MLKSDGNKIILLTWLVILVKIHKSQQINYSILFVEYKFKKIPSYIDIPNYYSISIQNSSYFYLIDNLYHAYTPTFCDTRTKYKTR